MGKRKYKVMVLMDFPIDPPDEDYAKHLHPDDWRPEKNVLDALIKKGHEAYPFAVYNDVIPLIEKINESKPDIVFNMLESFDNNRYHESNIVGLLELLKVPYTGNRAVTLAVCRNKFYTKRILSQHKIKLPRSVVFPNGILNRSMKHLKYPVFVKPLGLESSDGIAQSSFAETKEACMERVKFLHDKFHTDAMVEEYIEGRELYAGIIGNHRLRTLPLREMVFTNFPEDRPRFATFKAKWDKDFRKKWGIKNTFAGPIDKKVEEKIFRVSRNVYRALGLRGYGRLDLRLTPENDVYLIEVNPNPSIAYDDELSYAATRVKMKYPDLIERITHLGFQASKEEKTE